MIPADYLRLVVTSDGVIHLMWVRANPEADDRNEFWATSFVYHTTSADGGVTWSDPQPVTPPLKIDSIDLEKGAGGGLHLVLGGVAEELGGRLYYTHYDGTTWSSTNPVFTEGLIYDVATAVTEDGVLHLFTNYLPPDSPPEAYRPVYLSRAPQP